MSGIKFKSNFGVTPGASVHFRTEVTGHGFFTAEAQRRKRINEYRLTENAEKGRSRRLLKYLSERGQSWESSLRRRGGTKGKKIQEHRTRR